MLRPDLQMVENLLAYYTNVCMCSCKFLFLPQQIAPIQYWLTVRATTAGKWHPSVVGTGQFLMLLTSISAKHAQ